MKYPLIIFLFLTALTYGQYSIDDRQLAATTFTRNFDKVTCKEYLTSKDDRKVKAGLLSVSHSEDTSFVHFIIALPVEKFADEICFALGQLGPCYNSYEYLQKLFHRSDNDPMVNYYALTALGKTGDTVFAKQLISEYMNARDKSRFNGISIALFYLFTNGKIPAVDVRPVLEQELRYSPSRQFEAAFSLYRIGPAAEEKGLIVGLLKKLLNSRVVIKVTEKPVPYLLACLRKLAYFPDEYDLVLQLRTLTDFQSRIETVRATAFYNFKGKEEIANYLQYLNDDNKNISREAASSIKNMKVTDELKDYLKTNLRELLKSENKLERHTKGELYLSYISLFPENFEDIFVDFFMDGIGSEYLYKSCSTYSTSEKALQYLKAEYFKEDHAGKLAILEALIKFDQRRDEASSVLFSALNSGKPDLIATSADGLDSAFISANKDSLSGIIKNQAEKNTDNADFIECLISLENLSGKISAEYQKTILGILSGSQLYTLKKFVALSTDQSTHLVTKDIGNFNDMLDAAFRYKSAEILTDKGEFTITFLPEYAPVSVGNFCLLAAKGFFNEQKFHRVVPGFVIQGGDPTGSGWGGPGYEIISEFSPLEYNSGIVGMASSGKDTEGSQWFITTGNYPHLNGRYTIFAEVLKGMDVIEKITQGDKILSITLN